MNLNYGYDKDALVTLIMSADPTLFQHNLVIDFDGEVIIDPEQKFPTVALSSYKFATTIKDKTLHSNMVIPALYDALESLFDSMSKEDEMKNYADDEMNIAA